MRTKSTLIFWSLAIGLACIWAVTHQAEAGLAGSPDSPGAAQAYIPALIKDINLGTGSSILYQFAKMQMIAIGGEVYCSAMGDQHPIELWKSDGSAAGTQMVKAINPTCHAWPTSFANLNGCSSSPQTACTARNCGRAMALPKAPCWSRISTLRRAASRPATATRPAPPTWAAPCSASTASSYGKVTGAPMTYRNYLTKPRLKPTSDEASLGSYKFFEKSWI